MFNEALKKATPRAENGAVNVFVETPKDSRHKYDLDQSGLFSISIEMPEGQAFPFSFGFIPGTEVADGDCLDVILITTGSAPAGALIQARLIGVLKMENDEEGEMVRNDRLVAVANMSRAYRHIGTLGDLHNGWVWDAEVFFETYNRMIERPFKIVGTGGISEACQMPEKAGTTRRARRPRSLDAVLLEPVERAGRDAADTGREDRGLLVAMQFGDDHDHLVPARLDRLDVQPPFEMVVDLALPAVERVDLADMDGCGEATFEERPRDLARLLLAVAAGVDHRGHNRSVSEIVGQVEFETRHPGGGLVQLHPPGPVEIERFDRLVDGRDQGGFPVHPHRRDIGARVAERLSLPSTSPRGRFLSRRRQFSARPAGHYARRLVRRSHAMLPRPGPGWR